MQLLNNKINFNYYNNISFQMKKSEFNGFDRKVVEDTRVDVGPFKNMGDFNNYCDNLTNKITNKDYGGRREETKIQRQSMLQEWFDYVLKGLKEDTYTPSITYIVLNSITNDLKPNEDSLPPILNKGVLARTINTAQNEIVEEKNLQFNFGKMYRLNLQKEYLSQDKEKTLDKNLNGWIIIPSKKQDPKNFDKNVEKLKVLSHNNWCTESYNAEPYLEEGEFHVYMEKGKPKLGVRFVGDKIQEIQGPRNNSRIPVEYSDIAMEHIKNYKLTNNAKNEVSNLKRTKKEVKKFLKNFPNGIENASTQEILETAGIKCEKDKDGLLIISHYNAKLNKNLTFEDLGVNENKLFKSIKEIKGDAYYTDSQVTSLGELQSIGRSADFSWSQITSLGNLQSISGYADFRWSQITSLGNLKSIGGDAVFNDSQVKSLGELQTIGGNADFKNSQVKSLGELQSIGWSADFKNSQVTSLGELQSIGGSADFRWSKITSLGKLKSISGNAYFYESQVTSLDELQSIGKDAHFNESKITSLGKLKSIGGDANFEWSQITSLGDLQSIGRNAYFRCSQVTSLGKLQSIGLDAYINNSKLKPSDFDNIYVGGKIAA